MDEDEGAKESGHIAPAASYRGTIFSGFAAHNTAVSRLPQRALVAVVQVLASLTVSLITGFEVQVLSVQRALHAIR
jgi:3-deoxy-D-arabino-heptulosonate 7-phosphate (DAHP) synthase class II